MARRSRNGERLGAEDALWKAANKLRGLMDANERKHVVLGLALPKYIDDAFAEWREKLTADLAEEEIAGDHNAHLLPSGDEYTTQGLSRVLPEARWEFVQSKVHGGDSAA